MGEANIQKATGYLLKDQFSLNIIESMYQRDEALKASYPNKTRFTQVFIPNQHHS